MKKSLCITFLTILTIACTKKTVPVITERKYEPSKGIVTTFPSMEIISADTVAGKSIFMARCSSCHGLPEPTLYSEERWDGILSSMIPKARLSKEQGVHITAYLKANASQ